MIIRKKNPKLLLINTSNLNGAGAAKFQSLRKSGLKGD